MVSWLNYLGNHLIPFKNPIQIRITFIILSTLTLYIWFYILKWKNFSEKTSLIFGIIYCLNPMLGIGSILGTPDVPFVFFWSFSYLCFLKILDSKKLIWYFLLGLALGLGFCSKYIIVLFVLAGLIHIVFNKQLSKLKISGVLVTLFSGLVFSLPVLIWNYQNEWASFLFQINHGFGRDYYEIDWTLSYALGQIFITSPFIFFHLFKKRFNNVNQIFSLTNILFFLSSSFKAVVEANWPIASYPHSIGYFVETASTKKIKYTFIYWAVIYSVLIGLLVLPFGFDLLKNQPTSKDVIELRPIVNKFAPLYGPTYQISSLLSWDNQKLIPKLSGLSRFDYYDRMPESKPTEKIFYVLKYTDASWPNYLSNYKFTQLERFDKLDLELYKVSYE